MLFGLYLLSDKNSKTNINTKSSYSVSNEITKIEDTNDNNDLKQIEPDKILNSPPSTESKILNKGKTKYVEFNQILFDAAITDKKIVLLNFYANWCPICRAEEPGLAEGLNLLGDENIVAFRVNYNDSDTDENEKAIAKKLGISYQHSKVILLEEKVLLKEIAKAWDKEAVGEKINLVQEKIKENKDKE